MTIGRMTLGALLAATLLVAGCSDADGRRVANVRFTLFAGPTCPVERTPPDPACAPRPVAGAEIALVDERGMDVVILSDADGVAVAYLEPGRYTATPLPVAGLPGIAAPFEFVMAPSMALLERELDYDTGIR
jgi:hypothetical protein